MLIAESAQRAIPQLRLLYMTSQNCHRMDLRITNLLFSRQVVLQYRPEILSNQTAYFSRILATFLSDSAALVKA